jgi:hypothetical protein
MRVLRDASRPRLRDGHDFRRSLLPAFRAAHALLNLGEAEPADPLRQLSRVDLAPSAALTRDAHVEKSEAVGQPLDMSADAHGSNGAERQARVSIQCRRTGRAVQKVSAVPFRGGH